MDVLVIIKTVAKMKLVSKGTSDAVGMRNQPDDGSEACPMLLERTKHVLLRNMYCCS